MTPLFIKKLLKEYEIESLMDWYPPPRKHPLGSGVLQIPRAHRAKKIRDELELLTRLHLERIITGRQEAFEGLWQKFQEELEKVDVAAYPEYKTGFFRRQQKLLE